MRRVLRVNEETGQLEELEYTEEEAKAYQEAVIERLKNLEVIV